MKSPENRKIEIRALTKLEKLALEAALGDSAGVNFKASDLERNLQGEPATITAVVSISTATIAAIATWLAKQRSSKSVSLEYHETNADGSSKSIRFKHTIRDEASADAEIIEALTKYLD